LAFESSAKAASVALWDSGVLVAESFQNNGKTHSATLMPMAERLLQDCGIQPTGLDYVAVAMGPGSFTGVRIGVAAAKGLAWAAEKPMVGISTLEGMAHQLLGVQGIICPVMDARRQQVYNALFDCDGQTITRRSEDRAISLEDLKKELENIEKPIFLVGDGSKLCYNSLKAVLPNLIFPPAHLEMQHASGVAMAAAELAAQGRSVSPADLVPNYLRLSQAERERLKQQNQEHGKLKGDS
jgi:tRNA threonylcarbamoyladenosine biosynthesis protein TsaB